MRPDDHYFFYAIVEPDGRRCFDADDCPAWINLTRVRSPVEADGFYAPGPESREDAPHGWAKAPWIDPQEDVPGARTPAGRAMISAYQKDRHRRLRENGGDKLSAATKAKIRESKLKWHQEELALEVNGGL